MEGFEYRGWSQYYSPFSLNSNSIFYRIVFYGLKLCIFYYLFGLIMILYHYLIPNYTLLLY